MTIYFGHHNIHDTIKAIPGIGSLSVDVPFIPDYIKVDFHGPELTQREDTTVGEDRVYWDLVTMSPTSYQLNIGWSVYSTREIYYRISRLTVDPV